MQSCVRVVTPGGTFPGTSTITGITDARTGAPFAFRTNINCGGYAAKNTLEYQGPDDSAYHWDFGMCHDTNQGGQGGGICHDFGIKVASGADSYGFGYMDTWPDIFFGGYIGGFGYFNNILPGSTDITWNRRDRNGDSRLMIFLAGTEYDVTVSLGNAPGVVSTFPSPQGLISIPGKYGSAGSGPAVTAAGGTGWEVGWAARGFDQAWSANSSGNQNGNSRVQALGQFGSGGGVSVSSWDASSYTVAGSGTGGGNIMAFCGADVVCRSGHFNALAANGDYSFNLGLNPAVVCFTGTGQAAGAGLDTTQAAGCFGAVDPALSQGSFWSGDTTVGVTPPVLLGARWLSDVYAYQSGFANGGSTTFSNKMQVTALDQTGNITVRFTAADGVMPEIRWWSIGTVAIPPPPPVRDYNIMCPVPLPLPVLTR